MFISKCELILTFLAWIANHNFCINYFCAAIVRYLDQGNLQKSLSGLIVPEQQGSVTAGRHDKQAKGLTSGTERLELVFWTISTKQREWFRLVRGLLILKLTSSSKTIPPSPFTPNRIANCGPSVQMFQAIWRISHSNHHSTNIHSGKLFTLCIENNLLHH